MHFFEFFDFFFWWKKNFGWKTFNKFFVILRWLKINLLIYFSKLLDICTSFWRVLLKTFWIFFEVKVFFSVLDFFGKIVLVTEFFDRIFFYFCFVDCAIFLVLFEGFCWRPFGCFLKWKFSFGFFWENFFRDRIFWSELFFFVFLEIVRYFWFFLKGFVEDLLDAFWSENSVLDFFGKIFFVTEFFGQNFFDRIFFFFFCRLCDIFGSFWRVLLKTFWMLFEVKIQFWIFLGKFFSWQNFLVRIFIFFFFFVDCVLYYRDFIILRHLSK